MAEIKALNCPSCGGSIPDISKACNYCGSKVALSNDRTKFELVGKLCPNCNYENRQDYKFCSSCGESLSMPCLQCGRTIELDSIFCPFCQAKVESMMRSLISVSGLNFPTYYPQYKNRCKHLIDEIRKADERKRLEKNK